MFIGAIRRTLPLCQSISVPPNAACCVVASILGASMERKTFALILTHELRTSHCQNLSLEKIAPPFAFCSSCSTAAMVFRKR